MAAAVSSFHVPAVSEPKHAGSTPTIPYKLDERPNSAYMFSGSSFAAPRTIIAGRSPLGPAKGQTGPTNRLTAHVVNRYATPSAFAHINNSNPTVNSLELLNSAATAHFGLPSADYSKIVDEVTGDQPQKKHRTHKKDSETKKSKSTHTGALIPAGESLSSLVQSGYRPEVPHVVSSGSPPAKIAHANESIMMTAQQPPMHVSVQVPRFIPGGVPPQHYHHHPVTTGMPEMASSPLATRAVPRTREHLSQAADSSSQQEQRLKRKQVAAPVRSDNEPQVKASKKKRGCC